MGHGVHSTDERNGRVRIGIGPCFVHMDLKTGQIGKRVQRCTVDIRVRGDPTQGFRWYGSSPNRRRSSITGRRGSSSPGRRCSPAPAARDGPQYKYYRNKYGPSNTSEQLIPPFGKGEQQQTCHNQTPSLSYSYEITCRLRISIMKPVFLYCILLSGLLVNSKSSWLTSLHTNAESDAPLCSAPVPRPSPFARPPSNGDRSRSTVSPNPDISRKPEGPRTGRSRERRSAGG